MLLRVGHGNMQQNPQPQTNVAKFRTNGNLAGGAVAGQQNTCGAIFIFAIFLIPITVVIVVNVVIAQNSDGGFNFFFLIPVAFFGLMFTRVICAVRQQQALLATTNGPAQFTTTNGGTQQMFIGQQPNYQQQPAYQPQPNFQPQLTAQPVAAPVPTATSGIRNFAPEPVAYPVNDATAGNQLDLDPMVKRF